MVSEQQQQVARNQSFSSESRGRSRSILDSAMRYEKNKTETSGSHSNESPSKDTITQNYIRAQQQTYSQNQDTITQNYVDDHQAMYEDRSPVSRIPVVASDSRGLKLSHTEYYDPSENDEKLIKPSEYKVHRFNDRHRTQNIVIGTDTGEQQAPPENRIVMMTDDNKAQQQQQPVIGRRAPNNTCLLYTSPSPRDKRQSRMPSSA